MLTVLAPFFISALSKKRRRGERRKRLEEKHSDENFEMLDFTELWLWKRFASPTCEKQNVATPSFSTEICFTLELFPTDVTNISVFVKKGLKVKYLGIFNGSNSWFQAFALFTFLAI